MDSENKEERQQKFILILAIFLLLFIATCFYLNYQKFVSELRKEYYKNQMVAFCKIAEEECDYPFMYPCDRWLVD